MGNNKSTTSVFQNDTSSQNTAPTPRNSSDKRLKEKFLEICERSNRTVVDKTCFQEYVMPEAPLLSEPLYNHLCTSSSKDASPNEAVTGIDEGAFVTGGSYILALPVLDRDTFYVSLFASDAEKFVKQDVEKLFRAALECAYLCCRLPETDCCQNQPCFQHVVKSMFGMEDSVDISQLKRWVSRNSERLTESLHEYTCHCLQSQQETSKKFPGQEVSMPIACNLTLYKQLTEGSHLLTLSRAWLLSCLLPSNYFSSPSSESASHLTALLSGGWTLLYNSEEQGLSVNRFQHHAFSYQAPTVTLFSFDGHCYCMAASTGWREDRVPIGGDSCYLVQLQPQFKIIQSGSNLFFLNFKSRDLPKGLQIGSDPKTRFLHIDDDFHQVKHYCGEFQLHRLETWGCGGLRERQRQLEQRDWEKRDALRHKDRKLKLEDWETSPDRQLLDWGGVNVDHASADRDAL